MDSTRFDDITRQFADPTSRRSLTRQLGRVTIAAVAGLSLVAAPNDAAAGKCKARNGITFINGSFQGPNKCTEPKAHLAFENSVGKLQCVDAANPGCGGACKGKKKCKRSAEILTGGTFECHPGNPGDNPACPDTAGIVCTGSGDWECFCTCRR